MSKFVIFWENGRGKFIFYTLFSEMVTNNPWDVEPIETFLFLKCPECAFDTKEENFSTKNEVV